MYLPPLDIVLNFSKEDRLRQGRCLVDVAPRGCRGQGSGASYRQRVQKHSHEQQQDEQQKQADDHPLEPAPHDEAHGLARVREPEEGGFRSAATQAIVSLLNPGRTIYQSAAVEE